MAKINTSSFKRLIGVWKTSGQITTQTGFITLNGIDSYEFILDGNYILHKANVMMGTEKSETFEIISLEGSVDKAQMQYFNARGESGTMMAILEYTNFLINGDRLKFIGTLNNENSEIIGQWYRELEDKEWEPFIDLKLEKQN